MDEQNITTEATVIPEVENKSSVSFVPTLYDQAMDILRDDKGTVTKKEEVKEETIFEKEDIADLLGAPFDLAAIFTKYKGWELTLEEKEKLSRVWLKPMQKYLGTVAGMSLYIAAAASVTIITDKTLGYLESKELENKKRNS